MIEELKRWLVLYHGVAPTGALVATKIFLESMHALPKLSPGSKRSFLKPASNMWNSFSLKQIARQNKLLFVIIWIKIMFLWFFSFILTVKVIYHILIQWVLNRDDREQLKHLRKNIFKCILIRKRLAKAYYLVFSCHRFI